MQSQDVGPQVIVALLFSMLWVNYLKLLSAEALLCNSVMCMANHQQYGLLICRVQQESVDEAERNIFLVNYVDYSFDDFGGRQPPVYPGLSTVWGSLARSKVNTQITMCGDLLIQWSLVSLQDQVNFLLLVQYIFYLNEFFSLLNYCISQNAGIINLHVSKVEVITLPCNFLIFVLTGERLPCRTSL